MSFIPKDKFENHLGSAVGDMDQNGLVTYFIRRHKLDNKVDMNTVKADYKIAEKFLIEQYGQPHAGRIVKWLFYRYGGKVTVKGEVELATMRTFNASMKWWVDKLNLEQQQAVRQEQEAKDVVYVSADF